MMRFLDIAAAVTVLGFIGFQAHQYATFDDRNPIVGGLFNKPLNSPVREGDSLIIRTTREKVRDDCPVVPTRYAIDQDGIVYQLAAKPWKGGPADVDFIDLEIDTESLPPGQYTLQVSVTYNCPGIVFVNDANDTKFRVVPEGYVSESDQIKDLQNMIQNLRTVQNDR